MTDQAAYDFVLEVLTIFDRCDTHSTFFWRVYPDGLRLLANCSDIFWWGSADCEEITPNDLPLLRSCAGDLKAIDEEMWLAELYAARRRGDRPQGAVLQHASPELVDLFARCGPPQKTGLGNPYPWPGETPGEPA